MGTYLVMFGPARQGAEPPEERMKSEVRAAGGSVRFSWQAEHAWPVAALVIFDDDAKMESLAARVKDAGDIDLQWLGAGQEGPGDGGEDSGHIKAGHGGGHIKAGNV